MADTVVYEVTQPVMAGGTEVCAPGTQFASPGEAPDGATLRPVVVAGDPADEAVALESAAAGARPAVNAPKADWVAYAVSQGRDPAEAEALTKAALIEAYSPAAVQ